MHIQPYLTPYKYGKPVLAGSGAEGAFDKHAVDCPFVFRHNDRFYMMYVGFDGVGYQTALAVSDDLLHWTHHGLILERDDRRSWDGRNVAGTWMMRENDMHGPATLKKRDGKYWLAYHSYPGDGYEEGSARIGLAWTEDESLMTWHRLDAPVLTPEDGADWERGGLYKECLLEHEGTYYLFYNAKNQNHGRWVEQTGVAISRDLLNWERHPHNPVLKVTPDAWDSGFASDPCVLRNGAEWAMFFFGYNYRTAQEGLALSGDLLNWEKWPEPIITTGADGELDSTFAHKPSVLTHDGVLYHFYTASRPYREGDSTNNIFPEFRSIAVATSRPLQGGEA